MNNYQKKYIENNIELIRDNNWDKFFDGAPRGIGGVLYEAGFKFLNYITYVPAYSFNECSNITSVTIPDGVMRIGEWSFCHCEGLTSITIPDGVTSIETGAFIECSSLASITIPSSVTSIGNNAFIGCSNLEEITYNGTKLEFASIDKERYWRAGSSISRVICSNGVVKFRTSNKQQKN